MKTAEEFIASLSPTEQAFIEFIDASLGDKNITAYILLDGQVVKTTAIVAALWQGYNQDTLIVGKEFVEHPAPDRLNKPGRTETSEVSTVFLIHACGDYHFETMYFGDERSFLVGRWQTLEEAKKAHAEMVRRVKIIGTC